jgi:hypothetical protein
VELYLQTEYGLVNGTYTFISERTGKLFVFSEHFHSGLNIHKDIKQDAKRESDTQSILKKELKTPWS